MSSCRPSLVLLLSSSCPLATLTSPGQTDWPPLNSVAGLCDRDRVWSSSCPALLLSSLVAEQLAMSMLCSCKGEKVGCTKKSFLNYIGPNESYRSCLGSVYVCIFLNAWFLYHFNLYLIIDPTDSYVSSSETTKQKSSPGGSSGEKESFKDLLLN